MKLVISASPHIDSGATTRKIMGDVLIALCPALIAAIVIFGWRTLLVTAVCAAACVFFEWGFERLCHKPSTIGDLSAVVTGVILAYNLPVSIPLWQAVFGCLVAIVAVKQLFGGIGKNFANPALVGRIVLFLSFSKTMTAWVFPDAVSSATPLAQLAACSRAYCRLFQQSLKKPCRHMVGEWNTSLGRTVTATMTSPAGPPLVPALPMPERRKP